jgi:hypothetical protein
LDPLLAFRDSPIPAADARRQPKPVAYGPWFGNESVEDFLRVTFGAQFASRPDTEAQIAAIVNAFLEQFISNVSDLKQDRCTILFLEGVIESACPGKAIGILPFILKHLGEQGRPWKPAEVQAPAPAETRVTADKAAELCATPRWGTAGAGGANNNENWPLSTRAPGANPSWAGLG